MTSIGEQRTPRLHYPGDLTGSIAPDDQCGCDAAGRPYAVMGTEYDPEADRTIVYLRPSEAGDLLRWQETQP